MLEQKIQDLTAQVETLTKAVEALTGAMQGQVAPSQPQAASEPVAEQPAPEPDPAPSQEATQDGPKREDLQDLCMTIVRSDRSKRGAVKAAIAQFDGAETLKDVPEDKLGELKAALEAL
ncbi:MAG: hypothetical protein R3268_00260 [Acidiferrobacterales bacterium]|nr:hypothetical protein [Acidiferrobacterales bacterium]